MDQMSTLDTSPDPRAVPALQSWLKIDPSSHFSLQNIPFGIITTADDDKPRPAVAIGDLVLDLRAFTRGDGFDKLSIIQPHQIVFDQSTLNDFAALGRPMHRVVRQYLQSVFLQGGPFRDVLERNEKLQQTALIPAELCTMHLPMRITDYTDFYAGLNHAFTVGSLFRGPENALQPNYKHLPVGYHGRASSIVVSGTPIRRPSGQILVDPTVSPKQPILAPSRKLDYELELGCFVCKPSPLGQPISIESAEDYLFGLVLLNDWSARDIQAWEYVPLGPFNSKNFATTISPWVVLMDALEPFTSKGLANDVQVLPYLAEKAKKSHFKIDLSVDFMPPNGITTRFTTTQATNLLFSFPQMLTHHAVGGCPFNVGDLLGSGTISGTQSHEKGCLLEMNQNSKSPIVMKDESQRLFLEDGDTITISGVCGSETPGGMVGFGTCSGRIEKAIKLPY